MAPNRAAFTKVVTTDTSATSAVFGGATGSATVGQGGIVAGSGVLYLYDATLSPSVTSNKAKGTLAAPTIVASGDPLFYVEAKGWDGAAFQPSASLGAYVDTTPGAGDMPGQWRFSTSADGAATLTERMRINSAGNVGIGTSATTVAARLHVLSITEQIRAAFDASNYLSATVAGNGATTLAITGGGAFTFSQAVTGAAGFSGALTGNVTGNVSGTAATVTTAAQPAITSLGTLTALNVAGQTRVTGTITPTQLVGNTDDWGPTGLATANVIRMDVSMAIDLTGIVAQPDGTIIVLYNLTTFAVTLKHNQTSSAVNRFFTPNAQDFPISQKASAWIRYDGTDQRWTVIAREV